MPVGERYQRHLQRCGVIARTLELPPAVGAEFVAGVWARFPLDAPGAEGVGNRRRRVSLLCQAFFGRLPRRDEFDAPELFEAGGPEAAAARLFSDREHRRGGGALRELTLPDPAALVLDVSHTLRFPVTGGIQRVVRSLVARLERIGLPHQCVRFCRRTRAYLPLESADRARLAAPAPGRPAVVRIASRAWNAVRRGGRPDGATAAFLWNQPLLIPEIVPEAERIDALAAVLATAPLRSALVFYDALPLRHAEFFDRGTRASYASYLGLLRHVAGVSCISETVASDLRNILPLVDRRGPPPVVAVHALGADFAGLGADSLGAPTDRRPLPPPVDRPLVLCVGTIEPRKNQLRILEAMVRAQAGGCRFRGVFVGNAGWLNGAFRDALRRRIAEGHDLELHENVSDQRLAALYAQAAFTVYCSIAEGFGLPIVESVMRGRVCITSRRGSMQEVAARLGGCLLVDPEDAAEIAGAIARLLGEPATLAALRREAACARWPAWADYAAEIHRFCITLARAEEPVAMRPAA